MPRLLPSQKPSECQVTARGIKSGFFYQTPPINCSKSLRVSTDSTWFQKMRFSFFAMIITLTASMSVSAKDCLEEGEKCQHTSECCDIACIHFLGVCLAEAPIGGYE